MTTNKFLPFMMANVQANNYENGKVFVYSTLEEMIDLTLQ